MVEAALPLLGAVQGYGDYEHFSGRLDGKLRDRGSEGGTKAACSGMNTVIFQCMNGGADAARHRFRRKQLAYTRVARGGRSGRDGSWKPLRLRTGRRNLHSVGTRGRDGRRFQSSRHHKLARKRNAAEGSCRECRRQEGGWNRLRPEDFGVPALQRANGISPIVNRRSSVNRSSCGRRTSLLPGRQFGEKRRLQRHLYL